MGVCWECAVRVDGQTVRACVVPAAPGLVVETLRGMSP
jgi:aerobic-type carbon monoxide dehydrogenase small subunit (CoxS/CutS family)